MFVRSAFRVSIGEMPGAHTPVRLPFVLVELEGSQPQSLSLAIAGESVERDAGIFHNRVPTNNTVIGHSYSITVS